MPLPNLTLTHTMFSSAYPNQTVLQYEREMLCYMLTGKLRVYADGYFLGTLGGRTSVCEPQAHVLRFPARLKGEIHFLLDGYSADCLIVSCDAFPNYATQIPFHHWNETTYHSVGTGRYQRTVAEVPTPRGFQIHCGETLNTPGGTSSFPPHATTEDIEAYRQGLTHWHETMFFVSPRAGAYAELDGVMPTGKDIKQRIEITNGDIMDMCLGSHPITAPPETWIFYAWFFVGTAVAKEYNRFSIHTGTYIK